MQTEYTFAQFLDLDVAAKEVLTDKIAEIQAIEPANTVAADVEASLTSELDPMPRTTFPELKARSAWMVEANALLTPALKVLNNAAQSATVSGIKADLRALGVNIGAVAGTLSS
jgi:hypothetical protein